MDGTSVQRELDRALAYREENMLFIFVIFGLAIAISLYIGLSGKK